MRFYPFLAAKKHRPRFKFALHYTEALFDLPTSVRYARHCLRVVAKVGAHGVETVISRLFLYLRAVYGETFFCLRFITLLIHHLALYETSVIVGVDLIKLSRVGFDRFLGALYLPPAYFSLILPVL